MFDALDSLIIDPIARSAERWAIARRIRRYRDKASLFGDVEIFDVAVSREIEKALPDPIDFSVIKRAYIVATEPPQLSAKPVAESSGTSSLRHSENSVASTPREDTHFVMAQLMVSLRAITAMAVQGLSSHSLHLTVAGEPVHVTPESACRYIHELSDRLHNLPMQLADPGILTDPYYASLVAEGRRLLSKAGMSQWLHRTRNT